MKDAIDGEEKMGKPNIVLIVMDAVRAQNTSLYGYERETTPNLKEISKSCVLYKNAISASYWTLPSTASLFTGTYVSKHGLISMYDVLDSRFMTMAEILRKEGYRTIGLCRNPFISGLTGLDRGFEIFYDYQQKLIRSIVYHLLHAISPWPRRITDKRAKTSMKARVRASPGAARKKPSVFRLLARSKYIQNILWSIEGYFDKSAAYLNQRGKELMRKVRKEPFFLYIHYDEAHTPYIMPRKFRDKFSPVPLKRKPLHVNQDHRKYYSGEVKMGKSDFQILQILYDGGINYLDMKIYEIFLLLEKQELLDNTMVIITSDHGDSIGEHGIIFHTLCLYDTLIKIPLLIKYPAELDLHGTENQVVQNVDIFPTIIDIVGATNESLLSQIEGNSLITCNGHLRIKNRTDDYAISELLNPFYSAWLKRTKEVLKEYDRQLISMRTEKEKYIYATNGNHEFYDLENDPEETNNLIDSKDPAIEELREKLKPWLARFHDSRERIQLKISQEGAKTEFETEIKQRLKDLGYL